MVCWCVVVGDGSFSGSLSEINRYLTVTPTEKDQKKTRRKMTPRAGFACSLHDAAHWFVVWIVSLLIIDILPYLSLSTL